MDDSKANVTLFSAFVAIYLHCSALPLQHCRRRRLMLGARINLNLFWDDMRTAFAAAGGPTSPDIYRPTGETEALQNAWNELRELTAEQKAS